MPYGVLPALVGASEEGEALLEEGVDFAEGELFGWGVLDGHDDEGYVGVRGFFLATHAGFLLGGGGFGVVLGRRVLRGIFLGLVCGEDDAVLVEVEVVEVLLDVDALVHDGLQLAGWGDLRQLVFLHHSGADFIR